MQRYFEELKPKLIYVFRVPNEHHKGCLKVGETTLDADGMDLVSVLGIQPNSTRLNKAAKGRIDQYTQTVATPYELLHTEIALYQKGLSVASFQDKDVHQVLLRSGIRRKEFPGMEKYGKEWFVTDLATVKNAIKAVKEGRQSLGLGGDIDWSKSH